MTARDGHVRVLPLAVANKIAAGEVVERPASVVKELVENAIDAGARQIRISVTAGGRKLISVQDDGAGMTRDDAILALERQATSKILDVTDIEEIDTLGFRGEAIPSIASVSRFTITTRRHESDEGTCVQVNAGTLAEVRAAGCPPGTLVEVRDLFCNVPARRKFLRAYATEEAHVKGVFTVHALAHPEIGFTLVADGRERLRLAPAAALRERVLELFGAEFVETLLTVPADTATDARVRVSGFIERPNLNTPTRRDQYVFVNGRPATAPSIAYALREAYPRRAGDVRPAAILFIDLPPGDVDVNVHPTKREVRFRDNAAVRDALSAALARALGGGERPPVSSAMAMGQEGRWGREGREGQEGRESQEGREGQEGQEGRENLWGREGREGQEGREGRENLWGREGQEGREGREAISQPFQPSAFGAKPSLDPHNSSIFGAKPSLDPHDPHDPLDPSAMAAGQAGREAISQPFQPSAFGAKPSHDPHDPLDPSAMAAGREGREAISQLSYPQPQPVQVEFAEDPDAPRTRPWKWFRFLAQSASGYLLVETDAGIVTINPIAARERIAYERLKRANAPMQTLLIPETVTLSPVEAARVGAAADALAEMGFQIEPFGPSTFKIDAVPQILGDASPAAVLATVARDLEAGAGGRAGARWREEAIAKSVARSFAGAPIALTNEGGTQLVEELCQCEMPYVCPRGKPVMIFTSTRELERKFAR